MLDGGLHGGRWCRWVGQVAAERPGRAGQVLGAHPFCSGQVAVGEQHPVTACAEGPDHGGADAGGAAGDKDAGH